MATVKIKKLTGKEAKEFDKIISQDDGYIKSIQYLIDINKLDIFSINANIDLHS